MDTVEKVPDRPVRSTAGPQNERAQRARWGRLGEGLTPARGMLGKALPSQMLGPPSSSQDSGTLATWPGDLMEGCVCVCV